MSGYSSAVRVDFVFGRQPGHVLSSLPQLSEKDFQEISFPIVPSKDFLQTGVPYVECRKTEKAVACDILPVFSEERRCYNPAMERRGKSREWRWFSIRLHFPGFNVRRQHPEEVVSFQKA